MGKTGLNTATSLLACYEWEIEYNGRIELTRHFLRGLLFGITSSTTEQKKCIDPSVFVPFQF
jgi:hypothetical protein